MKAYVGEDGRKYYPLASWERTEYKLENLRTRAANRLYDSDWYDGDAYDEMYMWEKIIWMASMNVREGMAYLPYPEYEVTKEALAGYGVKRETHLMMAGR